MQPEEIEEMLYQRALRSRIRPPFAERLSNLGYNRVVTSGVVAGAALVCTLAMNNTGVPSPTGDRGNNNAMHPQVTGTDPGRRPAYPTPNQIENTDQITTSLAMSRIAN